MNKNQLEHPKVVSQAEWLEARKELLRKEKDLTRQKDALSAERRNLPWVRVDKEYVFDTPGGKKALADLFEGRSQLIVYHFMFGPEWQEGCPSCSFNMDHADGALVHLAQRDVTFLAVSRAPLPKIEAFKKRMGWRFTWVSAYQNDFNRDFHVSFTKEEMAKGKVYYNYDMQEFPSEEAPGISVFYKDGTGDIFHTYSTYARGSEVVLNTYNYLDLVPKGRDEDALPFFAITTGTVMATSPIRQNPTGLLRPRTPRALRQSTARRPHRCLAGAPPNITTRAVPVWRESQRVTCSPDAALFAIRQCAESQERRIGHENQRPSR